MKKIVFLCILSLNFIFALSFEREQMYENQAQVLRTLDIPLSFMSDLNFVKIKKELESKHSGVLIRSLNEFSKTAPMIRQILKQEGVPQEFLYLAMIESGLKNHSTSHAKAVGIWQFMPRTAKDLGLRIDAYVDERRDAVKSTHAAATYLKRLYERFGKWYLAILAYNSGDAKLAKAIKKAGSDELHILLDADKKYVSLETRNFIRKILVLAFLSHDTDFFIEKDASAMNFAFSNDFSKVDIPSSVSLKEISANLGLDLATFKRYNPHFKQNFTPPGDGYYMYIPVSKTASFNSNFDASKLVKVDTRIKQTQIYIVKKGDTLSTIARAYKTSVSDIKNLNNMKNNKLSIKQKLILPLKENDEKSLSKFVSR